MTNKADLAKLAALAIAQGAKVTKVRQGECLGLTNIDFSALATLPKSERKAYMQAIAQG